MPAAMRIYIFAGNDKRCRSEFAMAMNFFVSNMSFGEACTVASKLRACFGNGYLVQFSAMVGARFLN